MKRYIVYISRVSYHEQFQSPFQIGLGDGAAEWTGTTLAESRVEALRKLLPAMRSEQPKLKGKFVSVFVGTRDPNSYPGRLQPIQVVIATWTIR